MVDFDGGKQEPTPFGLLMFHAIYYEREVAEAPLAKKLRRRYAELPHIPIRAYGEVFNPHAQNFRLQKQAPSLILANKKNQLIHPTPPGYGVGGVHNYYFSPMLNCVYDCRYCFLQGMYNSAHYVVFVNQDDFQRAILDILDRHSGQPVYFFSGYDCDSLALEAITGFMASFLPFFRAHPLAVLELRTKSIGVGFLEKQPPFSNCVVAFTLSPEAIVHSLEHRTPSLQKRLAALQKLQRQGWPIGLRFDPLIYSDRFESMYQEFFARVFEALDPKKIHSVSMGAFRLPTGMFKKVQSLYPEEKLFAHSLVARGHLTTYEPEKEEKLLRFCHREVLRHIDSSIFFPCEVGV